MEVFVFNPRKNRETLRQFNERTQEFCLQQAVVQIVPSVFGSNLILSLLLAEDLDQAGMPTFMPAIRPIKTDDADLEEQLSKFLVSERKPSEDEPRIPAQLLIVERKDKPDEGWAVALIMNGEADDEGNDGEGDDDDDDDADDDQTPPSEGPAVAFPTKIRNAEVVN